MKLLNVFLNALYPEGVACLLCNRNARLDARLMREVQGEHRPGGGDTY